MKQSRIFTYIFSILGIITGILLYKSISLIDRGNVFQSLLDNLFIIVLFFIFLTVSLSFYYSLQHVKKRQEEREREAFETYVQSIEQINHDMRKFKHDYTNMMSTLKAFIDEENHEALRAYFYEHILQMNEQLQVNEQAVMMLNNIKITSLKGLLTTKILQATSKGVPIYIEAVETITEIPIDPIPLNRIVGILIDNAIEAAQEVEDGEVRIGFILLDNTVLLVVSNKYDVQQKIKVHEIYKRGFSMKGKDRGIGLATLSELKQNIPNIHLRTKISAPYFIQELEFVKE